MDKERRMPLLGHKKYDRRTFTFGMELEVGDVRRSIALPARLGSWEHAETDVVNVLPGPYQYHACDPQGIDPPVGGEINTMPTHTWQEQVDLCSELLNWLRTNGETPTQSCISHNHVHVRVPGLRDDVHALKRLTRYVMQGQTAMLRVCHAFDERVVRSGMPAYAYLKWDCGRPMPSYMCDNIERHVCTFDDFIRVQCCGKDAVSRGRPFRYAINTYCLKHTDTVEFRLFRCDHAPAKLAGCLRLVCDFMDAALNNGPDAKALLLAGDYDLPTFCYDRLVAEGWERTKWGKERGKKQRKFVDIG